MMLFIILLQLWAISMCLNPDQQNSNINLDNRTLNIFQIDGNPNIQNSQNLKDLVDSSVYTDKNEIDLEKSKVDDYAFYFTSWGEKLDGIWEFTPYDSNLDHLSSSILSHSKGRISSNF